MIIPTRAVVEEIAKSNRGLSRKYAAAGTLTIGAGDVYAQTVRCLEIIRETMAQGPYSFADIVRTDVWMLNTLDWEKAAQAHRDLVGPDVRPVLSFIGCANFWHKDILVEVSVKAWRAPGP